MNVSKNEKKLLWTRAIMLFGMFVIVLAIFLFWLGKSGMLAWFASNRNVKSGGMTLEANGKMLRIDPMISIVPSVGEKRLETIYYMADKNGNYYRVSIDDMSGELAGEVAGIDYYFMKNSAGNYIPINLTGLFPGEKLEITLSFTNEASFPLQYRLTLDNFKDDDGKFTIDGGSPEDATPGTYSIMGIFFVRTESIGGVAAGGAGEFLSRYDTQKGKSENLELFEIASGEIGAGETIECVFSVSIDLSQYRTLKGIHENLLSKKRFTIGALRLSEGE